MSKTTDDNCLKFASTIEQKFNTILVNANIENIDFEKMCEILENIFQKILVRKQKNDKAKKRFSNFLNYHNYHHNYIKESLQISEESDKLLLEMFEDGPNENWQNMHIIIVSYISFQKKQNELNNIELDINYKGMIDKLILKIEEYDNSDNNSDSNDDDIYNQTELLKNPHKMLDVLNKELPTTKNAPNVMNGLICDIKDMLKDSSCTNSKNIVDISKDLSNKYQELIDSGNVNINDLLTGVLGLLNDPTSLDGQFDDIDTNNLPDPKSLLTEMTNDPNLKEAMGMLGTNNGGGLNMNMISSLMANMMSSDNSSSSNQNEPNTIQELEKEIERMMEDINNNDNTKDK
jgi:hypothetical protein